MRGEGQSARELSISALLSLNLVRSLLKELHAELDTDLRVAERALVLWGRIARSDDDDCSSRCSSVSSESPNLDSLVNAEVMSGLGLTLLNSDHTPRALKREISSILSSAGWRRYRRRRGESWVNLTTARALLTPQPTSASARGSIYDDVILRLSSTGGGAEVSGRLGPLLRLAQLDEDQAVRGALTQLSDARSDLLLRLEHADHLLIDCARSCHGVSVISSAPQIELTHTSDSLLTRYEADEPSMWRSFEAPQGWPALDLSSSSVESERSVQNEFATLECSEPPETICWRQALMTPRATSSHHRPALDVEMSERYTDIEALIALESSAPSLARELDQTPERMRRHLGVSALSMNAEGSDAQIPESSSTSQRLLLIRFMGRSHLTDSERRDLINRFASCDHLALLTERSHRPLIYVESGARFTPPLSGAELGALIRDARATHAQTRRSLFLCVEALSDLWRADGLGSPQSSEAILPTLMFEVSPWREHRGAEIPFALSPQRQHTLDLWLKSASMSLTPHAFSDLT